MKYLTSLFLLFLFNSNVHSQTLDLDLSTLEPGGVKVISENDNVKVKEILLMNILPTEEYSVWTETELEFIEPLTYENLSDLLSTDEDQGVVSCEGLTIKLEEYKELDYSTKLERDVVDIINSLENEIKTCRQAIEGIDDGLNAYEELLSNAETFLEKFQKVIPLEFEVETGETVKIYVKREDKLWTFILIGNQPGKWITSYGLGFTSQHLERRSYLTKQLPDSTVFQILKAQRPKRLDMNYVPTINFSYFPSQGFDKWVNHSLSAGLGFDLSAPVVFLGYNLMYRQNIGFSAGVAFQQQLKLKDKYSNNEIVSENLEIDQLHDKIYRPNVFISINLRFGENPFQNEQGTNED